MFKRKQTSTAVHWSVTDGRAPAGVIDKIGDDTFTARDANGEIVGIFPSVKAALAALLVLR
jgi:hypothetical protein